MERDKDDLCRCGTRLTWSRTLTAGSPRSPAGRRRGTQWQTNCPGTWRRTVQWTTRKGPAARWLECTDAARGDKDDNRKSKVKCRGLKLWCCCQRFEFYTMQKNWEKIFKKMMPKERKQQQIIIRTADFVRNSKINAMKAKLFNSILFVIYDHDINRLSIYCKFILSAHFLFSFSCLFENRRHFPTHWLHSVW